MQCPNCGKEALNVNGKFICLDCGIEITNNVEPASLSTTSGPAVLNHSGVVQDSVPATDPVVGPEPTVQPVAEHPVKDEYLATLEAPGSDTSGAFDFNQENPIASNTETIPEQVLPNPGGLNTNPFAGSFDNHETLGNIDQADPTIIPSSTSIDAEVSLPQEEIKPVINEVPTPAVDLPEESLIEATAPSLSEETEPVPTQTSPVEPAIETTVPPATEIPVVAATPSLSEETEPVTTEISPVEPAIETTVPPATEIPVAAVENEMPMEETPIEIPINTTLVNEPNETTEPVNPPTVPTTSPEDFFQPAALNIAPEKTPVETSGQNNMFDVFSTPNGSFSSEPMIGDLAPATPTKAEEVSLPESNEETIIPPVQEVPKEEPKDLDDLLNQYSSSPSPVAPPVNSSFNNTNSVDTVKPLDFQPTPSQNLNPNTIPTVENVFGPENIPATTPTLTETPEKPKINNKMLIIIGASVLGLLVILGTIFGIYSLINKNSKKQEVGMSQEQLLLVSERVSKAMDVPQSVTVAFDQKIDFSEVSIATGAEEKKSEELKKILGKSIDSKGTWKTDENENVALDGIINGLEEKKNYIKAEKSTYVFTNGSWKKENNFLIGLLPLFNAETKGGLFYNSKLESLTDIGDEEIEGETFKRISIKPKSSFLREILNVSPVLAATELGEINRDDLEIIAFIDSENRISRVSVLGSVTVNTEFYSGKISITAEGNYDYNTVKIEKPVATNNEPIKTVEIKIQEPQKKLVVTEDRG